MPEGPSIVILKESVQSFKNHEINAVYGNSKIEQERLLNQTVCDFKSWGKHFLICLDDFTVKIHLLMFGSYLVNEDKPTPVRLGITFPNGFINFYNCSVKILEGKAEDMYDFTADVMNDAWNPEQAKRKLAQVVPDMTASDALLEQDIFSGVGNIIKNEALYRIGVQPESLVGKIPEEKLDEMIKEARNYSFDFLYWKKRYELRKHWLVHNKKNCPSCESNLIKKIVGTKQRRSFYCETCQKLYQ